MNLNNENKKTDPYYADRVTIADCFRQFNRPEKLNRENEWYCDNCKEFKQAVKRIEIFRTPPLLILTLKRFKGSLISQKTNTQVHFPVRNLDMRKFMIQRGEITAGNQAYDLFAVIVHQGSLNGGHYTALAKNGEHWYEFNDRYVVRLKPDERKIVNTNSYILFYQKRGIDKLKDFDIIKQRSRPDESQPIPKIVPCPILKQVFKIQKVKRREIKAKKKLVVKLERKALMVRIKMTDGPDDDDDNQADEPKKRGRGRPKGSVNRKTLEKRAAAEGRTLENLVQEIYSMKQRSQEPSAP